jgi:uncharacterized repeat protein (TIGR03803 family)
VLLLLGAAMDAASSAQTFTTLHNFCNKTNSSGYCSDGINPEATLVQGKNGDLYGTTFSGGSNNDGVVFEITATGKLTTLYSFCSQASCTDGSGPKGGLLLATNGNFYGVTSTGGAYNYGSIFKITPAGKLTTLHSFNNTDGANPQAALIQATNGNFYGTTFGGGAYSEGTAFEITSGGTLTTLYSFCADDGCPDGSKPNSGLIQAADGNFYGVTVAGGNISSFCFSFGTGGGTFFQLTSSGTLTTLAEFCQPNGFLPNSAPVQASNGNFYGTTDGGGDNNGVGTVYEMTSTGSSTWLYTFCLQTGCPDGENPQAVSLGTDGNFYGTTWYGGANNGTGTVFEITPAGQLTTLHTFDGTDGTNPNGPLLLDTNGTFYGTTLDGGENDNAGTIFSLATGLGPFIGTIPTSGAAKTKVTILGTNLKGATAVTFNGTAATFKVVSASEITTTVPSGATSGTVTVTTSGGTTLNSYSAFQVP